jgi:adenylate cyclase
MDEADIAGIADWTIRRGLAGDSELTLLQGFCARCVDAGLPMTRSMAVIDTLHPVYAGRAFSWTDDQPLDAAVTEYHPLVEDDRSSLESWIRSPFYQLLYGDKDELRFRLELGEVGDFLILEELRQAGQTDYFALLQQFDKEAAIGEIDCFMSRWTTTRTNGFTENDLAALRRLVPVLGLAIKSASLARVAQSLVEAYLGRDPGRRVLQGKMSRGAAERINAVIWFSDMQGYTKLSERIESDQLIPFLNDYAEIVITSVHGAGGDVLKLMADGVLAIFTSEDPAEACAAALRAETDMRAKHADLNAKRVASDQPVSSIYLGMHIGDVFYGNIGSKDRLDFTVVGPAVNEASRIASMCRSVDRDVLFSSDFREALPEKERERLVSVGRYALRGVSRAKELFTLDPEE